MAVVFVNYRRADAGGYSRRLYEGLRWLFGTQLFKDTDSISGGQDFPTALRAAVASADILLAVMGADWTEQRDDAGRRRLEDPRDWVRLEIVAALSSGVPVIPVLLPGASMPAAERLPADIRPLARLIPHPLNSDEWASDVEALALELERRGMPRQRTPIGPRNVHLLAAAESLVGHSGGVNDVAFSPAGLQVVTAGGPPSMGSVYRLGEHGDVRLLGDPTVRVWRVADGSLIRTVRHSGWAVAVAAAPSGDLVASGDSELVLLWDLESGRTVRELRAPHSCGTAVAFSPDGTCIAAGSASGAVTVWRSADGSVLSSRPNHRAGVTSACFSPDGSLLASGSHDGTVQLWRFAGAGQPNALRTGPRLGGRPGAVRDVAFSPSGVELAAACHDGRVRRWAIPGAAPLTGGPAHRGGWATSVCYSPDGDLIATGSSDGALLLWPAAGGPAFDLVTRGPAVNALAFSPQGETLAVATWDQTVSLWTIGAADRRPA
jgi:hypothetical protein